MLKVYVFRLTIILSLFSPFSAKASNSPAKYSECESKNGFVVYPSPNRSSRLSGTETCAAISALDQILASNSLRFRYCYEKSLMASPDIGKYTSVPLTFQWLDGNTKMVKIERQESVGIHELRSCLNEQFVKVKVPTDFQMIVFTGALKFRQE